jgi:hypothetical protein
LNLSKSDWIFRLALTAIRLDSCPKVEGLECPFFGYFALLNMTTSWLSCFLFVILNKAKNLEDSSSVSNKLKNIGTSVLSDKSVKSLTNNIYYV